MSIMGVMTNLLHELVDFSEERQFPQLLACEAHVPGVIIWVPGQRLGCMNGLILYLRTNATKDHAIML